jgi:glycopeptide antibiotics resistance protein
VGRTLNASRLVSWALLVSLGLILSATITPLRDAVEIGTVGAAGCDLSRVGLARIHEILQFGDTGLNILLFVPLGVAIGLLPRSCQKIGIIAGAFLLPFAIEIFQLLVPVLHRGCQSADVADNLTGLLIGLAGGLAVGWLANLLDPRD